MYGVGRLQSLCVVLDDCNPCGVNGCCMCVVLTVAVSVVLTVAVPVSGVNGCSPCEWC